MSSDIFEISVESVEGSTAVLTAQLVHPDGPPPTASKTFALGMIANPFCVSELRDEEVVKECPLSTFMDADQAQDGDFLSRFADMLITDLQFKELPARDELAGGHYTITVYDSLWLRQLRPGMRWTTTLWAFESARPWEGTPLPAGFYAHIPADDPTRGLQTEKVTEANASYFEESDLMEFTFASMSEGNYMRGETLEEDITLEQLRKYHGKPVLYEGFWGAKLGTLIINKDDSLSFYFKSECSEGSEGCSLSDLKYVAEAVPATRGFDKARTESIDDFYKPLPNLLQADQHEARWKWGDGLTWNDVKELTLAGDLTISLKGSGEYYTYPFYRDFWTILKHAPQALRAPLASELEELERSLGWCKVCGYRAYHDDSCVLCGNEAYDEAEHSDYGFESESAYLKNWQEVHYRKLAEGYMEDGDRRYLDGPIPFEKSAKHEIHLSTEELAALSN